MISFIYAIFTAVYLALEAIAFNAILLAKVTISIYLNFWYISIPVTFFLYIYFYERRELECLEKRLRRHY